MIVVADTSPVNYLILIQQISVLHTIYGHILIPGAVHEELLDPGAPDSVRAWARQPPLWLEILSSSTIASPPLPNLDRGEAEAILLAEDLRADWLLIDETDGREEATRRGLRTVGTLGILLEAHRRGLLDLRSCLHRLRSSGFYVSASLIQTLLSLI